MKISSLIDTERYAKYQSPFKKHGLYKYNNLKDEIR